VQGTSKHRVDEYGVTVSNGTTDEFSQGCGEYY
jgi:hypothetical protein